jgi:cardiolipin synthase
MLIREIYKFSLLCLTFLLWTQHTPAQQPNENPLMRSDLMEMQTLKNLGFNVTDGNMVYLLKTGHDKFEDLFKYIAKAENFIHMEYFNYRNDSINSILIHLLHQKAQEGIEVRVMYDAFGNSSNNQPFSRAKHDSICALGIQLEKFDPLNFPWLTHIYPRDHRKIVVIDGQVAYTGGMNVADYYIEGLKGIGPWRDMHMHIEGPAVIDIHKIFIKMWAKQTGQLLTGIRYLPPCEKKGNIRMAVIDREPNVTNRSIRQLYISMLDNAQKNVKIVSPYFMPTASLRKAIKNAVKRGVDVQIMLSEKSDVPMTPHVVHFWGRQMAKAGVKVYLYQTGFHHTKIMTVDDSFCTIGSSNLDARSLRYDYEINTAVFNKDITMQLVNMFEEDKKESVLLDDAKWQKISAWHKFVGWFGHILTPVM